MHPASLQRVVADQEAEHALLEQAALSRLCGGLLAELEPQHRGQLVPVALVDQDGRAAVAYLQHRLAVPAQHRLLLLLVLPLPLLC